MPVAILLALMMSPLTFGQIYTIYTVAGNGLGGAFFTWGDGGGFSGDNGPPTSAELLQPFGAAVDSAGTLYIADTYNNRIRKVSNGLITTIAGNGTQGFSGDGGPATSAGLGAPEGVAVDSAGNVYVADTANSRIRVLTACTYSVAPASLQAPAAGGNLTVSIQTGASCSWAVSGLPGWITVSSASSASSQNGVTISVQ